MASIAEIIMAQGRQQANARRERGGIWSSIIPQLATLPNQIAADRAGERQAQEEAFSRYQTRQVNDQRLRAGQRAEDAAGLAAEDETALASIFASPGVLGEDGGVDLRKATAMAQQQAPQLVPRLMKAAQEHDEGVQKIALNVAQTASATRANQPTPTKLESFDPTRDLRDPVTGELKVAGTPEVKPEEEVSMVIRGPNGRPMRVLVPKSQVRQGGVEEYREPRAANSDNEPLTAIIGPDGKPVLVRRSQAEGKTPASTREQGRAVTSGDAGRFAELQTSLDDLKTLRATLFPDANLNTGDEKTEQPTGTRAAIGAALWNPITEFTGVGAAAKQRQAVIDRVKQVIGKALEGGVLRKEDELKYEKILPTIRDVPSVVKAKLDGLDTAIQLRLQRDIEARADAGYDVSRFLARGQAAPKAGVTVTAPDGSAHSFTTQAEANAFKRLAGIP